jgi:hypothetical protein
MSDLNSGYGDVQKKISGFKTFRQIKGFGSTYSPGIQATNQQNLNPKPPGKGYTSFVGTTTAGLAAPVW